jgi:hypothetical protein
METNRASCKDNDDDDHDHVSQGHHGSLKKNHPSLHGRTSDVPKDKTRIDKRVRKLSLSLLAPNDCKDCIK